MTPSSPNGAPPASNPCALGTPSVQRRFVNNTGQPITKLRLRVVDITTLATPYYIGTGTQADIRLLSSDAVTRAPTALPLGVNLKGAALESTPVQIRGGGWNSDMAVDLSSLSGGRLGTDEWVDVQMLLGVAASGSFRFFIVVEALPWTHLSVMYY